MTDTHTHISAEAVFRAFMDGGQRNVWMWFLLWGILHHLILRVESMSWVWHDLLGPVWTGMQRQQSAGSCWFTPKVLSFLLLPWSRHPPHEEHQFVMCMSGCTEELTCPIRSWITAGGWPPRDLESDTISSVCFLCRGWDDVHHTNVMMYRFSAWLGRSLVNNVSSHTPGALRYRWSWAQTRVRSLVHAGYRDCEVLNAEQTVVRHRLQDSPDVYWPCALYYWLHHHFLCGGCMQIGMSLTAVLPQTAAFSP